MNTRYFEEHIKIPQLSNGEKIFHYTSISSLQSIVENKEFWVTESSFLNDTTEFKIGETIINELLEHHILEKEILVKIFNGFSENMEWYSEKRKYYVISCCLDEDSPLMWAEYSKFMGYSIKFDFEKLLDSFNGMKYIEHGKVVYDHDLQIYLLKKTLNHYIFDKKMFANVFEKSYSDWNDFNYMTDNDISVLAVFLVKICEMYNMFFKSECFAGEHEYRFIFSCNHNNNSNMRNVNTNILQHFRIKDKALIPFIKCNLKNMEFIEGVFVGPKNNSDVAIKGIEYFLKSKGINVPVKKSALPLRY